MTVTLANKYRPTKWEDVVEQSATVDILRYQLHLNRIRNAYLFTGGAGTGKTTCARIFANSLGNSEIIEIDGATNNGVAEVKEVMESAKTRSLVGEYKVIIYDECHAISQAGWQAMLKIIEEPPVKTVFIFCTTNPEKIPNTILSRVQRYDFNQISTHGVRNRLERISAAEFIRISDSALDYIATRANGGMRDGLSLLDKCLAYSDNLTLETVLEVIGDVSYRDLFTLTDAVLEKDVKKVIKTVEKVNDSGKDIQQFIKKYATFLLDVIKYGYGCDDAYMELPTTDEVKRLLDKYLDKRTIISNLLGKIVMLQSESKWSTTPKEDLESTLVLFIGDVV